MQKENVERRKFISDLISLGFTLAGAELLFALSGCATSPGRRNPANAGVRTNESIAIIGAGASGISAAHFLRAKGYHNITLYEAGDHVGGKCSTVEIDGRLHDMGEVFTTSSYDEVKRLARQFQVPIIPLQGHTEKSIVDQHGVARAMTTVETAELGLAAYNYLAILKQYPRLLPSGFPGLDRNLCAPLAKWMKSESAFPSSLNEFFGFTFTPFGYGSWTKFQPPMR